MKKMVSFAGLKVGQKGEISKKIEERDVKEFSLLSLDDNPIHMSEEFASNTKLGGRIVHGMLVASLISAAVGTRMPGPGSVWMDQNLRFLRPVRVGDTIRAVSELVEKIDDRRHVVVRTTCYNQDGKVVIEGSGIHKILAP